MMIGNPRGNARDFAHRMAAMVLSEGQGAEGRTRVEHLVDQETHPDLVSVEPQSKSRKITTDEIRDLNLKLNTTSFEGGWKVAILRHADRLQPNAANAFLKTLEEPPPRTLILLITESPQAMLSTVISRCQRLILSEELADQGDPVWSDRLGELLSRGWPADPGESLALAAGISSILTEQEAESKKRIEKEDDETVTKDEELARISSQVIETRSDLVEFMIEWYRDVLVQSFQVGGEILYFPHKESETAREAERIGGAGAQECLERLWGMQTALERNLPADRALLNGLRPIRASFALHHK
jgi:DNA polymerase-3 subunit delta'